MQRIVLDEQSVLRFQENTISGFLDLSYVEKAFAEEVALEEYEAINELLNIEGV